jgi:hypothetical protein
MTKLRGGHWLGCYLGEETYIFLPFFQELLRREKSVTVVRITCVNRDWRRTRSRVVGKGTLSWDANYLESLEGRTVKLHSLLKVLPKVKGQI